jgi:hypothetical protein
VTETLAVFLLQGALLAGGLLRRPQRIMLVLAAAWGLGLAVAAYWPPETRLPIIIALEALLIAAMGWLYRAYHSDRALIVMWLGTLKIVWEIAAVLLAWPQYFRAAGINGAFIVQILVGGGFVDGVMAWLGHRARGLCTRLLGSMAGI